MFSDIWTGIGVLALLEPTEGGGHRAKKKRRTGKGGAKRGGSVGSSCSGRQSAIRGLTPHSIKDPNIENCASTLHKDGWHLAKYKTAPTTTTWKTTEPKLRT